MRLGDMNVVHHPTKADALVDGEYIPNAQIRRSIVVLDRYTRLCGNSGFCLLIAQLRRTLRYHLTKVCPISGQDVRWLTT